MYTMADNHLSHAASQEGPIETWSHGEEEESHTKESHTEESRLVQTSQDAHTFYREASLRGSPDTYASDSPTRMRRRVESPMRDTSDICSSSRRLARLRGR